MYSKIVVDNKLLSFTDNDDTLSLYVMNHLIMTVILSDKKHLQILYQLTDLIQNIVWAFPCFTFY